MKLCLLSVILLLVPLVSADLRPHVLAKILYNGFDDQIIGEAVDTHKIEYKFTNLGQRFQISNQGVVHEMIVQGTLDEGLNRMKIAVEVFDKEAMRGSNCYKQTQNRLIPAIKLCFNNIGIRDMTQEEMSLLHKYQWEQHETKEVFKVVHERNTIRTKSHKQKEFKTFVLNESDGNGKEVFVKADDSHSRVMWLQNTNTDTPVVIVGHRDGTGVDCRHLDSLDMSVKTCKGQVSAKRVNGTSN